MNAIAENQNQTARTRAQADGRYVAPPANISATDNAYLVELEMPGVDKSGLEITVEANELTIIGRRKTETPQGELCYCESALADYRRSFELGPDIDTSKIEAEMDQGVLKLRLPKSEKAKPRKVQISG
ncbi:MAG: heat-shock protein Hsp20 [Acidobacteria bacterium]|nr:MAG: heat-shock protein Hsp20 [Acidobacteriota bacterium]